MTRSSLVAVVLLPGLLGGCQVEQPTPEPRQDRGTEAVGTGRPGAPPRGATVDDQGRWTITSAPPLEARDLSRVSEMKPLAAGKAISVFAEPPPDPRHATEMRGKSPMSDLILRVVATRLIVDHGCFRVDLPGKPLVRFNAAPRLQRDKQGYLVIGGHEANGTPAYARIGEPVTWNLGIAYSRLPDGSAGPPRIEDEAALGPLRKACGGGDVVFVVPMVTSQSLARFAQRETAVAQYQRDYGMTEPEARRRVARCVEDGPCTPPIPPPVPSASLCPPGTRYEGALCRTSEGYIRPIPPAR